MRTLQKCKADNLYTRYHIYVIAYKLQNYCFILCAAFIPSVLGNKWKNYYNNCVLHFISYYLMAFIFIFLQIFLVSVVNKSSYHKNYKKRKTTGLYKRQKQVPSSCNFLIKQFCLHEDGKEQQWILGPRKTKHNICLWSSTQAAEHFGDPIPKHESSKELETDFG